MKAIRTATVEGKNWKRQLNTFLEFYRNTPHSTTGKTPAECIFGHKLRTHLPQIESEPSPVNDRFDAEILKYVNLTWQQNGR